MNIYVFEVEYSVFRYDSLPSIVLLKSKTLISLPLGLVR